jgi:HSP20 family molecular chaperone IbpA
MNILPHRDEFLFPLEAAFDKFFNDFFGQRSSLLNSAKSNTGYPKLNYYSDGKEIKLVLAVPGCTSEDLELSYNEDNTLTIKGRMHHDFHAPESAQFYARELRQSSFVRTVSLPETRSPPTASLENGILIITWKIEKAQNKPKQVIQITQKRSDAREK